MSKPKILLLSNLNNESPEEDLFLQEYLAQDFSVTITHPLTCDTEEDTADLILIRNIWLTHEYQSAWKNIQQRFIQKNLLTYNPLTGSGDAEGKTYLTTLWKKNYPVIPTSANLEDLSLLPPSDTYIIKPKYGGSSVGVEKINKQELLQRDLQKFIVQPYIDFDYELSFYFIDNKLQHTLFAPDKTQRWELEPLNPSSEDIAFAQRFVKWNTLPFGIQRVDACRLNNGELLLMEIEDLCPYLSLLDINPALRDIFTANLTSALQKQLAIKQEK